MSRFLSAYMDYARKASDAPSEFHEAAGLMCISAIAAKRRRGEHAIPSLFLLLVGPSTVDRKSTAIRLGKEIALTGAGKRIVPSEDMTAEALAQRLSDVPNMTIIAPEFGYFLASMRRDYGTTMSPRLCQAYDGETFEVMRSKAKPIVVDKPRLNILGGVAYGMIRKYGNPLDWQTGFYSRCLFVRGSPHETYPIRPPEPTAEKHLATARYSALLQTILDDRTHFRLRTTPEASTIKIAFGQHLTNSFPNIDDVEQTYRGRLTNDLLDRLALLYQIDIDPAAPIGEAAIHRAAAFAWKCWWSFKHVYDVASEIDRDELTYKIWRRISEAGERGVLRRDLLRALHRQVYLFNQGVENLLKAGAIKLEADAATGTPRLFCLITPAES